MAHKQQVLVLYLKSSALDSEVAGWAVYDGSGETRHMAGDSEEPPYKSGLAALRDGWRLIQASPLVPEVPGFEFRTAYLKYEFFFEKLVPCPRNNFVKLRRIFRRWQGATTSSGRPHGRRSNAVNGEKDQQIREVISRTGH